MARKITASLGGIVAHAMSLGLVSRNPVREAVQYGKRRARLSARHTVRLEVGVEFLRRTSFGSSWRTPALAGGL
jgi:hypothetical protein